MTNGIVLSPAKYEEFQRAADWVAQQSRITPNGTPGYVTSPLSPQPPDVWLGCIDEFDPTGASQYDTGKSGTYWITSAFNTSGYPSVQACSTSHQTDDPKYRRVVATNLAECGAGRGPSKRLTPGTRVIVFTERQTQDSLQLHYFSHTAESLDTQNGIIDLTRFGGAYTAEWYRENAIATTRPFTYWHNNATVNATLPASNGAVPETRWCYMSALTRVDLNVGATRIMERKWYTDNLGRVERVAAESSAFTSTRLTVITNVRDNAGVIEVQTRQIDAFWAGTASGWTPV